MFSKISFKYKVFTNLNPPFEMFSSLISPAKSYKPSKIYLCISHKPFKVPTSIRFIALLLYRYFSFFAFIFLLLTIKYLNILTRFSPKQTRNKKRKNHKNRIYYHIKTKN